MAAPKQSGHLNAFDHAHDLAHDHGDRHDVAASELGTAGAPAHSASHSDATSTSQQARSGLPVLLIDDAAYERCPSRWERVISRAVPASVALLGALALGSTVSLLGPADPAHTEQDGAESRISWTELARIARMQLVAADAVYAPQALTGAASDLTPDGSDQGGSRAERAQARREAAEARRAAAKERREAAKQARLEARQARIEARKARAAGRDDEDEEEEEETSSASDRRAAAKEKRAAAAEARREKMAERRAAAKEKREAAAEAKREAAEERRSSYSERRAAAKEKREAAAEARHAAIQERREAAKEKREARLAAKREAAEERREAKEERLAARESRDSEASPTVSSGGFGRTQGNMVPANGAALLRINSRPWAQVYVDGRLVGNTPQLALQLPPGEHNVRLVNGIFAMGKVLNVKLRAGERVTRVEMLEE
jgi:hypothetical protein